LPCHREGRGLSAMGLATVEAPVAIQLAGLLRRPHGGRLAMTKQDNKRPALG